MPLPQGAGRTAGADASSRLRQQLRVLVASQSLAAPAAADVSGAASTPPRDSRAPLPGPGGFAGASGSTTSAATGLLLFAVATGLGFLALPQLARVLVASTARARPYPYLLRLERPG